MDNYIIAKLTDVGRAREVNEDSMTVIDSPNGLTLAVCDGMGGQAAGDTASQLAVSIIENILTDNKFTSPQEAIQSSVMAANQGVLNRASQRPELEGMGSTCAMIIINEGVAYCGWVGDSRIYYIATHTIRQISHDQSYVQQMVDSGQISAEEASAHPQHNEILNCIGLQGMTPPELATPIVPEPGSAFLICSDGLSSMVGDAQIERVVSNSKLSAQQKVERLVELANEAGGMDNITVELIQFNENADVAGAGAAPAAPATPASKATKKGSGRKALGFICAIVLAGGLATGAYFLLGNEDSKDKKEQTTTTDKTKQKDKGQTTSTVEERNQKQEAQTTAPEPAKQEQPQPTTSNRNGRTPIEREAPPKNNTEEGIDKELQGIIGKDPKDPKTETDAIISEKDKADKQ